MTEVFTEFKSKLKSKTVWGGVVALVAIVASVAFKIDITADVQALIVEHIMSLIAAGGALLAIYGRFKADKKLK